MSDSAVNPPGEQPLESASTEVHPDARLAATCPLCRANDARVMPFRYLFHGRHLHGVRCTRCSLVFVHPQPTADEIRDLYAEEYFTTCAETAGAHGPEAYMEMARVSTPRRERQARRLDALLRRHRAAPAARGSLLEVGCGPGFMLAELRDLGWQVRGLEISDFAARHGRERLGLDILVGPISPAAFPHSTFDAVLMADVLEHLPDPRPSLAAIASWLRPGGILLVAVPSTLNLWSARLGLEYYRRRSRFKTLRIPPYHLVEYTPQALGAMLTASGYRVRRIRQSAVPIGKMGLRGTPIENLGKVALQGLAHASARLFNRWGDRLLAIAEKPDTGA